MRDPRARGEADRTIHRIQMRDAVAFHRSQVEAIQDAQRQQVLEPLTRRRQRMHVKVAIRRRQRIEPDGLDRFQIGQRQAAAQAADLRDNRAAKRAAMQVARPFGGDRLVSARQVGLAQHLAQCRSVPPV